MPLLLPEKVASSTPGDPPQPWDRTSVIARISLPLPCHEEAREAPGPDPLEVGRVHVCTSRAPSAPLKDSLNHLNLPPLLVLPARWPPTLGPAGDPAPDRVRAAERAPCGTGGFQCLHCRKPYHTLAGLARHRELQCHLRAPRCFTCKYCDKEYSSLGALKMHIRTHTLPCPCAICGKAFSRPWLLQGHIRTHTGGSQKASSGGQGDAWGLGEKGGAILPTEDGLSYEASASLCPSSHSPTDRTPSPGGQSLQTGYRWGRTPPGGSRGTVLPTAPCSWGPRGPSTMAVSLHPCHCLCGLCLCARPPFPLL